MKKKLLNWLLPVLTIVTFTQCKKNNTYKLELIQIAKVMSVDAMRALPVGPTKATQTRKTGKIYAYNDLLFINEPNKGIHIYNNVNPSQPVNLAFLQIPGNVDLAISNNILYADSYVDLLAFDISNITNIKQVKRLNDVFKQFYISGNGVQKYVVTYKDTLINKETYYNKDMAMYASSSATNSSSGQGGSMARFTLMNQYLYTVGQADLSLFDVRTVSNPTFVKTINLAWGVETIFPYENKLFIGTNNGMHIFNATDASNPVKLSTYSHVIACDPVVVQGKYAYVTLRTGNFCRQAVNQLEVVDIEDPTQPKQVAVFPMKNPHGLSVSGNNLFLCEGTFGLKSFNITDKNAIGNNLLQHLDNIKSFDVIAGPKSLIVTGEDGVYQFNYSNASKLTQLSKIKVQTSLPTSIFN
ncbi:hypothetical protein EZ428_04340 [Pedobacter frigiditerrae]|uniref:LVIVD repeat-containing protein n=1 Tax=Pedobacter frigiditerrae TaxID=2530452 RepID=A0A4R0N2F0_9SPHI|nr:hypothetical protein [Pedobacter frigiditerrae]TCC94009.1 hypothetical protein EZ428_04340 [Pedobacter frigiditerrae]